MDGHPARDRIENAITELDEVIRNIRGIILNNRRTGPSSDE